MAIVVGPERNWGGGGFGGAGAGGEATNDTYSRRRPAFECGGDGDTAAAILIALGALGVAANVALMAVILLRKTLRR